MPLGVDGEDDWGVEEHGIDVVAFLDAGPLERQVVKMGSEAREPVVQNLATGAELVFLTVMVRDSICDQNRLASQVEKALPEEPTNVEKAPQRRTKTWSMTRSEKVMLMSLALEVDSRLRRMERMAELVDPMME